MQWRNSTARYGLSAMALHWLALLAVFGRFGLGLWMVELDYYSPWYRRAPALHKSIGLLLCALMLVRLGWRLLSPPPDALPTHGRATRLASRATHALLSALVFATMVAGYLISTADGRAIGVFGLFEVPALPVSFDGQEDIAGAVHRWLAWALMTLAGVHALAALKHHFIDRDATLRRMLGGTHNAQTRNHEE